MTPQQIKLIATDTLLRNAAILFADPAIKNRGYADRGDVESMLCAAANNLAVMLGSQPTTPHECSCAICRDVGRE